MLRERNELDGYFSSPEDRPPRHLAMLRAYLDESGHQGKGLVCVAGFMGNEEQWQCFVPKWRDALGKRKALHMSDLRWKSERTRRLLARLGPIPESCGLEVVMGGVKVSDYEDLVPGDLKVKLMAGYLTCVRAMVVQVLRAIPKDERVEFVFEGQREYERGVNLAMRVMTTPGLTRHSAGWFTSDGLPKIAKWGFVPKGTTIMTDPADYMAYAIREGNENPKSQKTRWCRPMLDAGDRQGLGAMLTRTQARRMVLRTLALNGLMGL